MSPEENKMSLQQLDAKLGRSIVKDVYSFVNIIFVKILFALRLLL